MINKTEKAYNEINTFLSMIRESWTWQKLTDLEKEWFKNELYFSLVLDVIKGSKNPQDTIQAFYHMFISALGYKPLHWRD